MLAPTQPLPRLSVRGHPRAGGNPVSWRDEGCLNGPFDEQRRNVIDREGLADMSAPDNRTARRPPIPATREKVGTHPVGLRLEPCASLGSGRALTIIMAFISLAGFGEAGGFWGPVMVCFCRKRCFSRNEPVNSLITKDRVPRCAQNEPQTNPERTLLNGLFGENELPFLGGHDRQGSRVWQSVARRAGRMRDKA